MRRLEGVQYAEMSLRSASATVEGEAGKAAAQYVRDFHVGHGASVVAELEAKKADGVTRVR